MSLLKKSLCLFCTLFLLSSPVALIAGKWGKTPSKKRRKRIENDAKKRRIQAKRRQKKARKRAKVHKCVANNQWKKRR